MVDEVIGDDGDGGAGWVGEVVSGWHESGAIDRVTGVIGMGAGGRAGGTRKCYAGGVVGNWGWGREGGWHENGVVDGAIGGMGIVRVILIAASNHSSAFPAP